MFDLIVRNGRIVDGTGIPGYRSDLAIQDGRIVEIGRVNGSAGRVIDAAGLVVAPGFIDHHTHFDAQILWDPIASSSCWHGVTTVITGNCSLSLAPCKPADRDGLVGCLVRVEAISRKALEAGMKWEWTTFGEYLDRAGRERGINVGCHVGHTAIRRWVMGDEASDRAATPDELTAMKQVLRESMLAGAIGFSVNQSKHHFGEDGKPIPATAAPREEVIELVGVLAEVNRGVLQVNGGTMGSEVSPEDNYAFLRALAQASGRPILFNTISQRWSAPGVWERSLELGADALAEGYRIHGTSNAFPTTFQFTLLNAQVLFDNMPTWRPLMFASREDRLTGFADPSRRAKLCFEALDDPTPQIFHKRWDTVIIKQATRPENREWQGRTITDLAAARGRHPVDAFIDFALSEDLETTFETIVSNGDREAVGQILRHPAAIVGTSDAGAHTAFLAEYGYCTELIGPWVRDRGALSLESAVSKLTMVPASIFGLHDRGQIRPGFAADLVLFDPETVAPGEPELVHDYPAGEARLVQPARGIHASIIGGQVFVEDGRHTGALPGRVLR